MELGKGARRSRARAEGGFTLIEVTIAMGLAAFAFAALGTAMAGGLRTLAVEKTRARANEVATEAIEDLQRLSYDGLGVCASAASTPPSGLNDPVLLPNCPAGAANTYGQQPCDTTTAGLNIPAARYTCTRLGRTYTVTRYVVYATPEHTVKRLAVFVDWNDQVGAHQVTQQSSIRSPSVASVIGLAPPVLSSPVVNPTTVQTLAGLPVTPVSVQVTVAGVSATDRVAVTFSSLDTDGNAVASAIGLTNAGGTLWSGQITAAYRFGSGSQYLSFLAVRSSDSKANSIYSSVVKFCPTTNPTCSSTLTLPQFSGSPTTPAAVGITAAGALKQDVAVSVVTQNITATDSVSFSFETLAGSVTVFMQPVTASCTAASCTWQGTIPKAAGYSFAGGTQYFYFMAAQDVNPDASSVDKGSTVATKSGAVTFS
jgi:type II secretory pathway pseudopilin PulG